MSPFASLSDTEVLLLVLAALYLVECLAWVRGSAAWIVAPLGKWGAGRVVRPGLLFGQDPGGPVLGGFFPFGRGFLCDPWPVSVGPQGALAYIATTLSPTDRLPQTERYVRFDQVKRFEAQGKDVLAGGTLFVKTASAFHAAIVADDLTRLAALSPDERARGLTELLARQTDVDAVRARLKEIDRESGHLKLRCTALTVLALAAAPWLYYSFRENSRWLSVLVAYLVAFFGLWFSIAVSVGRAHRKLEPLAVNPRRMLLIPLFVSPVAAMHAWNLLSRHLLARFHPLAVAAAVCQKPVAARFAEDVLRDALHPIHPASPTDHPEGRETESWFRARQAEALTRLTHDLGLDPAILSGPPDPQPGSLSYCPRCVDQYEVASGTCTHCGGLPLVPFETPDRAVSVA